MQELSLDVLVRDYLAAARVVDRTVYRKETAARIDGEIEYTHRLRREILKRDGGRDVFLGFLTHEMARVRYWAAHVVYRFDPDRAEAVMSDLVLTGENGISNFANMDLDRWRRDRKIAPFIDRFFEEWTRIRNLRAKSLDDLQRGFVEAALVCGNTELSAEGNKLAERAGKIIRKISAELAAGDGGRDVLVSLLEHPENTVSFSAALFVHSFDPHRALAAMERVQTYDEGRTRPWADLYVQTWREELQQKGP